MKAHQRKNIPIFIPHMGCPHRCVFCDQCAISGQNKFNIGDVRAQIEASLATLAPDATAEIAYFGGSFTAIERALMIELLDLAQHYVDTGRVSGIRFSTRPDALGDDVFDVLSRYSVTTIELGLQSMDDAVLAACRRGHTAEVAREACRRVVSHGYALGGQMMLGLPGSDAEKELQTAREICALGATEARVYPTVVFDGTALGALFKAGRYTPLTDEQAALRCAPILALFERQGVQLLRVGLCATEVLASSRVLGGANHPALGEMCYAAVFRHRMQELLDGQATVGRAATFDVPHGKTSQALGQKRQNAHALCEQYGLSAFYVREDSTLDGTQVRLILN